MKTIDIGKDFYHRLANRDKKQGDGKHTAIDFRKKYLQLYDNKNIWDKENIESIILDFYSVKKIGPSFANEAFAYFTKYAKPESIKKAFVFKNISEIFRMIIDKELETGYKGV